MTSWIDSHCHLPNEAGTAAGVEVELASAELVDEARAAGISALVDVGTNLDTSAAACQRAQRFEAVFATAGLHPHEASQADEQLGKIEALIAAQLEQAGAAGPTGEAGSEKLVAVGECGLDYFYENSDRAAQQSAFAAQIELARRCELALVIHSRAAWDDTFAVLGEVGVPQRTVFHCFTGGIDEARRALEIGAHISFSGIVSFKGAEEVRAAAGFVPAGSYLVETDAPYLAPVPHRGKTNRPAWVVDVGRAVAGERQVSEDQVATETSQAARAVFGLGGASSGGAENQAG